MSFCLQESEKIFIQVYPDLIHPAEVTLLFETSKTSYVQFPEPGIIVLKGSDDLFFDKHVYNFYRYVLQEWNPSKKYIALYMGCSNHKPFSQSFVHMKVIRMLEKHGLDNFVQQFIVSEPLTICPRELEETFPAANYDFPPNRLGEKGKKEFISRLQTFLHKRAMHMYRFHVGFMPNHHKEIFSQASEGLLEPQFVPYNVYQLPRLLALLKTLKNRGR